jgi:hypothetical protein
MRRGLLLLLLVVLLLLLGKLLLLVLMKAGRLPVTLLELGLLGMLLLKLSTEETESRQVRRTPGIVIVRAGLAARMKNPGCLY